MYHTYNPIHTLPPEAPHDQANLQMGRSLSAQRPTHRRRADDPRRGALLQAVSQQGVSGKRVK